MYPGLFARHRGLEGVNLTVLAYARGELTGVTAALTRTTESIRCALLLAE